MLSLHYCSNHDSLYPFERIAYGEMPRSRTTLASRENVIVNVKVFILYSTGVLVGVGNSSKKLIFLFKGITYESAVFPCCGCYHDRSV